MIPNQVMYVMKDGKVSKNLPNPLTPATISRASIREQVRATVKTDSFKRPRLSTYAFCAPIATINPMLIKNPCIKAVIVIPYNIFFTLLVILFYYSKIQVIKFNHDDY